MFFPYYFDPTMIILIPALILAMYAQFKVKSTYGKYSQVISRNGLTGAEVARELLRQNGIYNVTVHQIGGHLTDHYDPTRRVVNLSPRSMAVVLWRQLVLLPMK